MLRYRFPGENLICLEGDFVISENTDNQNFAISNFDQSIKYIWQEDCKAKSIEPSQPFCIDKVGYLELANQLIADLNRGIADKIVFSRIRRSDDQVVDPIALFEKLLDKYPNALVYYFDNTSIGTWIGASPEVLLERTSKGFKTMALAGTKLVSEDRDFSFKEYNEHAMVAEFIEGQLKQIPNSNLISSEIQSLQLGPVIHIMQEFQWQMPNYVLPLLIKHLHPTPAVAGLPKKVAKDYITAIESHQRGIYTGVIGRSTIGHEKLYVNLRCGQIIEDFLYCYVGGGFTPDSVAQDEWQESENKSQTLLGLL